MLLIKLCIHFLQIIQYTITRAFRQAKTGPLRGKCDSVFFQISCKYWSKNVFFVLTILAIFRNNADLGSMHVVEPWKDRNQHFAFDIVLCR